MFNKGVTGTAGSSAKAAGILAAPFGHGGLDGQPVDDSPARHAADSLAVGHHLGAPELVTVMAEQACAAVDWLEGYGVPFSRGETGKFVQLNAPGNSRPGCIILMGIFAARHFVIPPVLRITSPLARLCYVQAGQPDYFQR